jgi:23S rRNA (cytosine1962-C5)-methyltransferase
MENLVSVTLSNPAFQSGHPWVSLAELSGDMPEVASVVTLLNSEGEALGSGLFDPYDVARAWRRFSMAGGVHFDNSYIGTAIHDALSRRSDESCQRLIASDADYLPGLEVELYDGILTIRSEHSVVDSAMDEIVACLQEACEPKEIVLFEEGGARTLSGQNLKARWIEVDGLSYRLDLFNTDKPSFFLDQREQHALVGSLCQGRVVLDGHSHSGAFALQAARNGAEHVVAVDSSDLCVKTIGATAQKNDCFIETVQADVGAFLAERKVGELDAIILDPPETTSFDYASVEALHISAFSCLPDGGLLATYCRSTSATAADFEAVIASAGVATGREARIFARTAQPFDFPVLLNFPESRYLKGLILQVE